MKIYLATDHAGFELKEKLKPFIEKLGHEVEDLGAHELNPDDDYPDFVIPAAHAVAKDSDSKGIILGGSGQGEAIAANRIFGVHAIVYYGGNEQIITLSREHNDANILSLGARFLNEKEAKEAIELWLRTPFSGKEKYIRRIKKI